MLEYFEKNKEKIHHEPEETKKVAKFLKKGDVEEVFKNYDRELWHFFKFYCMCEDHKIGHEYEERTSWLNFKCLSRFAYQTNVVPTLISVDDLNYIFHRLMREIEIE